MLAPSSSFTNLTPWVTRPMVLIAPTDCRIKTPESVITIKSSESTTSIIFTIFPVLSVHRIVITPLPPRVCVRYCITSVLFPIPFSVATNIVPSLLTTSIPITRSWLDPSLMPITPMVFLPLGRMFFSENLIDFPSWVPSRISCSPLVILASISSSPSRISMA